LNNLG